MLVNYIRFLLVKSGFIKKPDFTVSVTEAHPLPEDINDGNLYLVKGGNIDKWACFKCPDGCGDTIKLSLSASRRPRWTVIADWLRRPTVNPSIRQTSGCFSHFWIKKGHIHWCSDTGKQPFPTRKID